MKKHRLIGLYTFHKPSLLIADLDLIKIVLTKEFTHFHDRGLYCNEVFDPLSGHLFLIGGQKWKNLRSKLTPTFTSGKLKKMFGIIKEKGDDLCEILESDAQNREIIEVREMMAR